MPDNYGKNTDILKIFNNYCVSTATIITRTRLTVTLCLHSLSCWS